MPEKAVARLDSVLATWSTSNMHLSSEISELVPILRDLIQSFHRQQKKLAILLPILQCSLISLSLLDVLLGTPEGTSPSDRWSRAVARLDEATILTGGEPNNELIEETIHSIQSNHLKRPSMSTWTSQALPGATIVPAPRAAGTVRTIDVPTLLEFRREAALSPFIVRGYGLQWPALNEHPWASFSYLREVAGPGRVVPVEVGKDYRDGDWAQRMIPWDDLLDKISKDEPPKYYMAQHSLFSQFPALLADIDIPPYVYCEPSPTPDYPEYEPPSNDSQLVINAWLGPKGTISPAHTVRFPAACRRPDFILIFLLKGSVLQLLQSVSCIG